MNAELAQEYLIVRQRLSALSDWRRIEQIRLEKYYQKTKNAALLAQITDIEKDRNERMEVMRAELHKLIDELAMTTSRLDTPLKKALFAHDLK